MFRRNNEVVVVETNNGRKGRHNETDVVVVNNNGRGRRNETDVVVVDNRGPNPWEMAALGVAVGATAASNQKKQKEIKQQEKIIQEQQAIINAQQQQAAIASASASASAHSQYHVIQVVVPHGVHPGMVFKATVNGVTYDVVCPAGTVPGMLVSVNVPKPQPTVIVVTETPAVKPAPSPSSALPSASTTLIVSAPKPSAPTIPVADATYVILERPHIVDENNPQMKKYDIISVPQEAIVQLIEGNLEFGLGGALHDYIIVNYNGKVGKISRKVVKLYPQPSTVFAPPPAIGDDIPPAL